MSAPKSPWPADLPEHLREYLRVPDREWCRGGLPPPKPMEPWRVPGSQPRGFDT